MAHTDITSEWQRCDLFADGPQTEIPVPQAVRAAGSGAYGKWLDYTTNSE